MDDVRLTVDGSTYVGWESVSISRALDALAGSFSLTLMDRWAGDGKALPLAPGSSCTVALGGDVVIAGYVDEASPSFSPRGTSQRVSGRDAAADLVDCSADHTPCEWSGLTLGRIAKRLAAPFGLDVVDEAGDSTVFSGFAVQPGETVFEALDRACRKRGVLAVSDPGGRVRLVRPGRARAATDLVQGKNVKSARATYNDKARHSSYTVRAQQPGTDVLYGDAAAQVTATATDAGVGRHRPLILTLPSRADVADARARARWEATVRAARAAVCEVVVTGWRQADDSLWTVGQLAAVDIPWLRIGRDMLVSGVRFTLDDEGSATVLQLCRPDAFEPQPDLPEQEDPSVWLKEGS